MSLSLRLLLVWAISIFLFPTACGAGSTTPQATRSSFKEGKIQISLPVKLVRNKEGYLEEKSFNDGGTRMVTIIDAEGKSIDVYIDHRLEKRDSWGGVYLYDYPDTPDSVRLVNQTAFKKEVLAPIGIE